LVDGDYISPAETAALLGLENQDQIDCMRDQQGD